MGKIVFGLTILSLISFSMLVYAQRVPKCNLPVSEIVTNISSGRTVEVPLGDCDKLDWAVTQAQCRNLASKEGYDCYQLTFSSKMTSYCYGCFK